MTQDGKYISRPYYRNVPFWPQTSDRWPRFMEIFYNGWIKFSGD